MPQLHGSLRWSRRQPLWLGRLACGRSRSLGADPDEAEIAGNAPGRCDDRTVGGTDRRAREVPGVRIRARRRQHEARPWPRQRATLEQGRVHEHDPRPARDRVSRRQELPHRRFRRGIRQHRRCPDGLSNPDGEVPHCRRADRSAGDGGRAAAETCRSRVQPALQEPPAARSELRRSHTPLRFRCRLRAEARTARPASGGRGAGDAGSVGRRQAGLFHQGRDEAFGTRLLQPVLRGADPRARARGRSHASARVRRRSLRQDAREGQHLQRQREQVDRFGDGHRAVRNEGRETEPQARPGLRSVVIGSPMRGPDPRDAGASRVPQAGARIGSRRSEAIRHIGAG